MRGSGSGGGKVQTLRRSVIVHHTTTRCRPAPGKTSLIGSRLCAAYVVSGPKKGCVDNDIALRYGSDRKESMGLAEVTMKHRELGTKKAMIERNMLVEEWEHAYEQDEWLTVRFPKIKYLKSNDGDAASPLEMISNRRISRSMITTELQIFVPVG